MERLKRYGSKLSLRRKAGKDAIPSQSADFNELDSDDENVWPPYDPRVFDIPQKEKRPDQSSSSKSHWNAGSTFGIDPTTQFPRSMSNLNRIPETSCTSPGEYENDCIKSTYGSADIPLFGPKYSNAGQNGKISSPRESVTAMLIETFNPYEDMIRDADADLQRAYSESLKTFSAQNTGKKFIPQLPPSFLVPPGTTHTVSVSVSIPPQIPSSFEPSTAPTPTGGSCIICVEDFNTTTVRRPGWISLACLHEPSTCLDCLAKCIRSDLDSKIWNQIGCPECKAVLIYEDIKRLADEETFNRYETLSFRSAISQDDKFVWCQKCNFGQLHESGVTQPIVRCLNCNFRCCFRHAVPWHDRLTCEEYDAMLLDPEGFQSAIDKEDEEAVNIRRLQHEEDERFARELDQRDKREEQDRQRQKHEEERKRARAQQEALVAQRRAEQERAQRAKEIKRRQMEENASLATMQKTTKLCPGRGCRWPIEKNDGCAHMTCIKCKAEFCWECLNDYNQIRRHGNSRHKKSCHYHTDNLA